MKDIYVRMLDSLKSADGTGNYTLSGFEGLRWAVSGGESLGLRTDKFLAVDGIHNVANILEAVENDKLEDVDFIEALACTGGCIGGPLTVENVYVARNRLNRHIDFAKKEGVSSFEKDRPVEELMWTSEIKYKPVLKLDDDLNIAMKKLETLERINKQLPGLDCGACGAPSCRTLAEDIVRGKATETDCSIILREKVSDLASKMLELEEKVHGN